LIHGRGREVGLELAGTPTTPRPLAEETHPDSQEGGEN